MSKLFHTWVEALTDGELWAYCVPAIVVIGTAAALLTAANWILGG